MRMHAARNPDRSLFAGAQRVLAAAPMWLRLFLPVATGLMVGLIWAVASGGADNQDACRIGAVSAEEYRTIAVEVAAMPPVDWDRALRTERQGDGVAAALHERLEQVLSARTSMDEQVAAMHALMRSIGAEFGWADRGSRDGVTVVFYKYRLDVNQIGLRRLLSRWAQIILVVEVPPSPGRAVFTRVVALMPEIFEPGRPGWKKPPQDRPCPPLPLGVSTRQNETEQQKQRS
jgi:hypothetical protein